MINTISSQENNKNFIKEIALEIINSSEYSVLTTIENNYSYTRTMDHFEVENDFIIYMGTNIDSRKVNQIKNNNNVNVHFNSNQNDGYVSIYGNASISNDTNLKNKFWKEDWDKFYPDKSKYRLIIIKCKSFEIISEKYNITGDSITWKSPIIILN
jgi:general stress protein 26